MHVKRKMYTPSSLSSSSPAYAPVLDQRVKQVLQGKADSLPERTLKALNISAGKVIFVGIFLIDPCLVVSAGSNGGSTRPYVAASLKFGWR